MRRARDFSLSTECSGRSGWSTKRCSPDIFCRHRAIACRWPTGWRTIPVFLDPAVVAAAMSVNLRFDDGFDEKHVLKAAFQSEVPPSILRRSKQPYLAPDMAPFLEAKPDYLDALLSDRAIQELGFLNASFCRAFTDKVLASPAARISPRESQAFVLLLSVAVLHQIFVKRSLSMARAPRPPIVRVIDHRRERRGVERSRDAGGSGQ